MSRCFDSRPLSELDTVTFFIVTELMAAESELGRSKSEDRSSIPELESPTAKVA